MTQLKVFCFVAIVSVFCVSGFKVDKTLNSGTTGQDVVEASVRKVHDSQVFDSDNDFLRRLAYVESEFGTKKDVSLEKGGIWQVTKEAFSKTQSDETGDKVSAALKKIHDSIESKFGIKWPAVIWTDLSKPFYSALAARIALWQLTKTIPADLKGQAALWKQFDPKSSADFVAEAKKLFALDFQTTLRADIIFAVDGAKGMKTQFDEVLEDLEEVLVPIFPKEVAHFGVSIYSRNVSQVVPLVNGWNETEVQAALHNVSSDFNETSDLEAAVNDTIEQFQGVGHRPGVYRYLVVMTDGNYDSDPQGALEVARKNESVQVFAFGIGDKVNRENLLKIADQPQNVFVPDPADHQEALSLMVHRFYSRPQEIETQEVGDFLRKGDQRFYRVQVFNETEATVWLGVAKGACWAYWALDGQPSEVMYDGYFTGRKRLIKLGDSVKPKDPERGPSFGTQSGPESGPDFGPDFGPNLRQSGDQETEIRELYITVACNDDANEYQMGVEAGDHTLYTFNSNHKGVYIGFCVVLALVIFGGLGYVMVRQRSNWHRLN